MAFLIFLYTVVAAWLIFQLTFPFWTVLAARLFGRERLIGPLKREANEALAIHHEHRVRDFARAKTFALKSLEMNARPGWAHAVHHRLARIERKMERRPEPRLLAY